MVTIKEALKLAAAGFTAEEIRQMTAGEPVQEQPAPAAPEPEQEPVPAEETPEPEQEPVQEEQETPAYLTADDARKLVESILKQSRQRENAQNAQRGLADKPATAQDVIRDLAKRL